MPARVTVRPVKLFCLLALLLVAAAVVANPSQAAGLTAPSQLEPTGSTTTTTPTLSWSGPRGATGYQVEVDDSPDFGSTLFSVTTTNDVYVHTARLRPGTWFWRVRATGPDGASSSWSTADFVVDQTAPPSPVSPVGGADLRQPDEPALLQWSPVPGAVGYQIEVDTEDDWVGATSYTSAGSSFQVPVPQAARELPWWWRVRADLGGGSFTQWSSGASYRILPLADVQQDPSMEVGGTVQDVVLKWLPVAGATKYELQVGLDRDFTQPVETRTVVSTRYSPPITYDNDQYFWRVRAIDSGGNKMSWPAEPFVLHRDWPQQPTLRWPADALTPAVGDAMYYQWTPVRYATRYQLDVGTDPNFSPGKYESCRTASTTYTPGYGTNLDCMPAQGQTTYWRVRALDAPASGDVEGIYSEIRRFVYDSGRVQLKSPADGATVAVPTLRWAAARDAANYYVEITDHAGNVATKTTTASLSWTPSGNTGLNAAIGPFSWTVQAVDAGGSTSPKYPARTFTLAGTPPTSGASPLTPEDIPEGKRFPSLEWEPDPAATYYRVRIGVAGSGFWDATSTSPILGNSYPYPAATDTGDHYLTPDDYMWQVKAVYVSGSTTTTSPWGPTGTFRIVDLPAVTGQRIALDGRALDAGTACSLALGDVVTEDAICKGVPATPVLDWDPVPEAGLYMVYLANDRELTNRVFTSPMLTTNTRWTPTSTMTPEALADNQAGESYYWYVRPCKTVNVCGPDPISTDRAATHAFRKTSPAVVLKTPAANSRTDDLAFTWEDYYLTNQAAPAFFGGAARSYQTARDYRIEISTSDSFANPIHTQEVDQATYTPFLETLPEGDLWWRVQAVDARGNRLAWSNPSKVTKDSGGATPVSPVDGVHVSGAAPFSWEAQRHAASYRLEVYGNDDATHSPANLKFAADTKLASYVWSRFLPPSASAYRWRVRWVDASGRSGAWSGDRRFFVDQDLVTLTAPGAATFQPASGPVFSWLPVPTAVRYKVAVRNASGGSVAGTTTAATSYAAPSRLVDGAYEWRVVAQDPSDGELAVSGWRPFTVDTTRPTVVRKAPGRKAGPKANFKVKFSEPVTGLSSRRMKLYVEGRTTPLPAKVSLSADGRVATLDPTDRLQAGKRYRVKVTSKVRDLAGNKLEPFSWRVRVKSS